MYIYCLGQHLCCKIHPLVYSALTLVVLGKFPLSSENSLELPRELHQFKTDCYLKKDVFDIFRHQKLARERARH